jgi:hypothetical protein
LCSATIRQRRAIAADGRVASHDKTTPRRSKRLIRIKALAGINQKMTDRLGKGGVHQY